MGLSDDMEMYKQQFDFSVCFDRILRFSTFTGTHMQVWPNKLDWICVYVTQLYLNLYLIIIFSFVLGLLEISYNY